MRAGGAWIAVMSPRLRGAHWNSRALLAAVSLAAGCGGGSAEWPVDVVRAVVVHIDDHEQERRVVVDANARAGGELPWGARQTLVTSGYTLSADAASDSTMVVSLAEPERIEDGWRVIATLHRRTGTATSAIDVQWDVRCTDGRCVIGDSIVLGASHQP